MYALTGQDQHDAAGYWLLPIDQLPSRTSRSLVAAHEIWLNRLVHPSPVGDWEQKPRSRGAVGSANRK